ncbi:MAG: protoglobin domain-containing protein [Phycisphaerae bacterium]
MSHSLLDDLKSYLGFTPVDGRLLAELGPLVTPRLVEVVDAFYDRLLSHPQARSIFTGGKVQIERQRRTLLSWTTDLFCGVYDADYFERRAAIGRTHVRVNLPQHYMVTSMNVIRLELHRLVGDLNRPDAAALLDALDRVIDLDLAIMLETYRADMDQAMRYVERQRFEVRLSESEHLARVGRLAAALAHEIKNPLAGISGALQIIGAGLPGGHAHKAVITEALAQIDRLDAAVKDLLIYARPRVPVKELHRVSTLLQRSLTLLREEPSMQQVKIRVEPLSADAQAAVDDALFQQVLSNLLLNAAHACEPGAEVICRFGDVNGSTRIEVEDRGRGMSAEVLARAFEPFFTTKTKGTGLGLAICRRIVEAHGGTIELHSVTGRGTRAVIDLPR